MKLKKWLLKKLLDLKLFILNYFKLYDWKSYILFILYKFIYLSSSSINWNIKE